MENVCEASFNMWKVVKINHKVKGDSLWVLKEKVNNLKMKNQKIPREVLTLWRMANVQTFLAS